jgi:hypothetical protein
MVLRRSALYDYGLAGGREDSAGRSWSSRQPQDGTAAERPRGWRKKKHRRKKFGKSAADCRRRRGNGLRSRKAPKARSLLTSPLSAPSVNVGAALAIKSPVIFRRRTSDPTEIKDYLSNAPATIAKTDLIRQAGLRSPGRDCARGRQKRIGDGSLRDPHLARLASSSDADLPGTPFSGASPVADENKSPALRLSQSKVLMRSVLGLPELDFKRALEIVLYHQERNYAAYCSHRKRPPKLLKRKSRKPK